MNHALNDSDIDKVIETVRNSGSCTEYLSAYRVTDTSGKTRFVMMLDNVGSLNLLRDDEGHYNLTGLELEDEDCGMSKTALYVGFNAIVRDNVGKEWLEHQNITKYSSELMPRN